MGELGIWGLGVIHLCDESKKIRSHVSWDEQLA